MPETLEVHPAGPIRGTIHPPGSKSITNRALLCAALAEGHSTLLGALDSEDTRMMAAALEELGIGVAHDPAAATMAVTGCGGRFPSERAELFVANSGTTVRFLTAALAVGMGRFRLHGTPRMHQRPIGDLLDALGQLGGEAQSERGDGCPPVVVRAAGLPGGRATVSGSISSQFLSGLLMAAPLARQSVELQVEGSLVSTPYVEMTLAVMADFGVTVAREDLARFVIRPQRYRGCRYPIEPDASAASYFFAAAAITGGAVTVTGLPRRSLQGDTAFVECLRAMGCQVRYRQEGIAVFGGALRGIDVDMNAISDTVPTLAAVALFAHGPTRIRNVAHVRHKETDRIAAVAAELRKLGATISEHDDGLTITPAPLHGASIATYDDHRMAMSLALVGLRVRGVVIQDPGCTAKTYPHYFDDLARLAEGRLR